MEDKDSDQRTNENCAELRYRKSKGEGGEREGEKGGERERERKLYKEARLEQYVVRYGSGGGRRKGWGMDTSVWGDKSVGGPILESVRRGGGQEECDQGSGSSQEAVPWEEEWLRGVKDSSGSRERSRGRRRVRSRRRGCRGRGGGDRKRSGEGYAERDRGEDLLAGGSRRHLGREGRAGEYYGSK